MSVKNKAIVLELGVNGLGVIRSLAKQNIEIVGVFTEEGPGCFSRYCRGVRFPKITEQEEAYKHRLMELCGNMEKKPVLFPTTDETVSFISRHRRQLKDVSYFSLPDEDVIENILNKDGTKTLAVNCGIKIPKTYIVNSLHDLAALTEVVRFPVIFKPKNTFGIHLPRKEKNLTFEDSDQLLRYFSFYPEYLPLGVFQEIISGGDGYIYICAGYFDENHDPKSIYTGRKIRQYLPDYGITCCGESLSIPEVADMTIKFMKEIKYTGLAAIEYVKDRSSGEFYFLEINARSYYHNSLFLSCGVNLPSVSYYDLINEDNKIHEKIIQKNGVVWIDFTLDLASFFIKYRRSEISINDWLKTILKARSFAVFDPNDLMPFFYNVKSLFGLIASRLTKVAVKSPRQYPPSPANP